MYNISSTCIVILETIALTTLEIQQGERAPVSGSRFSNHDVWAHPIFHICFCPLHQRDTVLWVETGRKNGLTRLVRSNKHYK